MACHTQRALRPLDAVENSAHVYEKRVATSKKTFVFIKIALATGSDRRKKRKDVESIGNC